MRGAQARTWMGRARQRQGYKQIRVLIGKRGREQAAMQRVVQPAARSNRRGGCRRRSGASPDDLVLAARRAVAEHGRLASSN